MRKMYLLEQKIERNSCNINTNSRSGSQSPSVISDILPMLATNQNQITTGFADERSNLNAKNDTDITAANYNDDKYRLFIPA